MPAACVETARLILRPFADDDVDALYEIQGNRDAMRYTHTAAARHECLDWHRTYAALETTLGFAPWTIVRRDERRIIGWGGLNVDPFDPGWGTEVIYYFHPAHWGRGYATELVRAALAHGFGTHALDSIGAFVRPANAASARVLQKCGFTRRAFEPRLERDRYEILRAAWQNGTRVP